MRKTKILTRLCSGAIAIAMALAIVPNVTNKMSTAYAADADNNIVIVLDPGHGGSDPGSQGNGLVERDINLKISTYTMEYLMQYTGVNVYMTRYTNDVKLTLGQRADFAASMNADILVSQHINSIANNVGINGLEVYISQNRYKPTYYDGSLSLAKGIVANIDSLGIIGVRAGNVENGTVKGVRIRSCVEDRYDFDGTLQDYYGIINGSIKRGFPGMIIEHGYISSPHDAQYLANDNYLKALGEADAKALVTYYGLQKANSDTTDTIIKYSAHVEDIGWQGSRWQGGMAGTRGASKRIEALTLELVNAPSTASINAKAYIQGKGWVDYGSMGSSGTIGTTGSGLRMEAVSLSLSGLTGYDVEYRTHVQDIGWTSWTSNGEVSGAAGQGKRVEGIQIRLVPNFENLGQTTIVYKAHVQNIGWMNWTAGDASAGTSGQSLRMEALTFRLVNVPAGATITASAHIEDYGWVDYNFGKSGTIGTTGQNKRIEALKLTLNGVEGYALEYRVHVEDVGWTKWSSQGEIAGTTGLSRRIEAVQMRLVPTASQAKEFKVSLQAHVQDLGWLGWVNENSMAGTRGLSKRMESLNIRLINAPAGVTVSGSAHVQDIGWINYNNITPETLIGTSGQGKRVESINFKLNGTNSYKLQYRVHVQNEGWTGWIDEGNNAGTCGKSLRLEGIEMRIVAK